MRHMVVFTVSLFFVKSVVPDFVMEQYKSIVYPPVPSFNCTTYSHEDDFEVHCRGTGLTEIPSNLNTTLNKLIISESKNISVITSRSFEPYKSKLQDVILSDLPNLRVIEEGTFANISTLRTIYIYNAPQIKFIYGLLKGATCKQFKSLRIVNTGLHEVPELFYLPPENTLFLLDLDHNKIEKLHSNSIKVTAHQVMLTVSTSFIVNGCQVLPTTNTLKKSQHFPNNCQIEFLTSGKTITVKYYTGRLARTINFNDITTIDDYAFNGSQIDKLHITSNPKLTELGEFAFKGIRSLRELDLSQTAITQLPGEGLETVEKLKIRETSTLHTIPSLYDLQNLKMARLTHHFHCCAFKYPKQHSPTKHAAYESQMRQICVQNKKTVVQTNDFKKRKRSLQYADYRHLEFSGQNNQHNLSLDELLSPKVKVTQPQKPLTGHFIDHEKPQFEEEDIFEDMGVFHSSPTLINDTPIEVFCGNISFRLPDVQCTPVPNALNPCEDIMGFKWLRNSVWFVVILAVVGNLAVVIVIWFSKTEINVSRFLICNLALADLCMGLYLLLIASMDYHSVGTYFNFAYDWQYGIGCQIAGFLTVFSGHLSIFTLTIVTLERWFAIKYAIDLTKRIRLRTAVHTMIVGWLYSVIMAMFPLLGISNYSSTSICLPMEVKSIFDKAYLYSIFVINGLSLATIVFCYAQIYLSLGYETRRTSHKGEMTIAKKMALLIFIDFATYTPVAFFGLCALIGYPLINITKSKILLVFFYPLNACANPYLYALMTSQYRRDLRSIVSRCGLCKERADEYSLRDNIPRLKPSPLLPKVEISSSSTTQCCHNNNCKLNQNRTNGNVANTYV